MSAKGKIARIPFELRQELNRRLRNGAPAGDLVAWLNELPAVKTALAECDFGGVDHRAEILPANLSEWTRENGPYAKWLADQESVEKVERLAEFSLRLAQVTGGSVTKVGVAKAAADVMLALEGAAPAVGQGSDGPQSGGGFDNPGADGPRTDGGSGEEDETGGG